jgi:hypothetical protein
MACVVHLHAHLCAHRPSTEVMCVSPSSSVCASSCARPRVRMRTCPFLSRSLARSLSLSLALSPSLFPSVPLSFPSSLPLSLLLSVSDRQTPLPHSPTLPHPLFPTYPETQPIPLLALSFPPPLHPLPPISLRPSHGTDASCSFHTPSL